MDSIPIDSLVRSTLFNIPLGGGPHAIPTGSLPTDRQILLRIVCTNLWPVSHTFSLPMEKGRFLYALLHGDSIDLPTFICHHILHTFKIPAHRIGHVFACLIHHLMTSLGPLFPDGVFRRAFHPIGHITFS